MLLLFTVNIELTEGFFRITVKFSEGARKVGKLLLFKLMPEQSDLTHLMVTNLRYWF